MPRLRVFLPFFVGQFSVAPSSSPRPHVLSSPLSQHSPFPLSRTSLEGPSLYYPYPTKAPVTRGDMDQQWRSGAASPSPFQQQQTGNGNKEGVIRNFNVTLKLEVSYTDHSHLIGFRGQTIKKVMEETGCHIHFPDSNRVSKDQKSNQVTIAGSSVENVELARARVRELSPIVFHFSLPSLSSPYELQQNADSHHVFVEGIQTKYGVMVNIYPPNKINQTVISVKGREVDADGVRDAINALMKYFAGEENALSTQVECTLDISPPQHPFVRSVNDTNIHAIMMNTGAKITFPDLSDPNIQQIRRSKVFITGDIRSVYNARQQILGCLPLRMLFDIDNSTELETARVIGAGLNVNVKLHARRQVGPLESRVSVPFAFPPQLGERGRQVQLVAHERNCSHLYEVRRRILETDEPTVIARIPEGYFLKPSVSVSSSGSSLHRPNVPPPLQNFSASSNNSSIFSSAPQTPLTPLGLGFDNFFAGRRGSGDSGISLGSNEDIWDSLSNSFGLPAPIEPVKNNVENYLEVENSPEIGVEVNGMMVYGGSIPPPPGFHLVAPPGFYSVDPTKTFSGFHVPADLRTILYMHGLEEYFELFEGRLIDLDIFSTLSERDLMDIGVKAYSARKQMEALISQLAIMPHFHLESENWVYSG